MGEYRIFKVLFLGLFWDFLAPRFDGEAYNFWSADQAHWPLAPTRVVSWELLGESLTTTKLEGLFSARFGLAWGAFLFLTTITHLSLFVLGES